MALIVELNNFQKNIESKEKQSIEKFNQRDSPSLRPETVDAYMSRVRSS